MPIIWQAIQKPTVLIRQQTAKANIARMQHKAEQAHVLLRPHFKTHQSVEIGRWFGEPKQTPIAVSNTDMAWKFVQAGWRDILLAIPINPREIDNLNELAASCRLTLVVEHEDAFQTLRQLQFPCRIFVEIDTGYVRTGMPWFEPKRLKNMLTRLQMQAFLTDLGLMVHSGHSYQAVGKEAVEQVHQESMSRLNRLISMMQWQGRRLHVSVGDTPSCSLMDDFPGATEIRPGNYVFYDLQQYQIGACTWEQIALAVACPIIARYPERGEVVVHGGAVHFSKDWSYIAHKATGETTQIFGQVAQKLADGWGAPIEGGHVVSLSQEHGRVALPPEMIKKLRLGDLLVIVPAHSCLTQGLTQGLTQATGTQVQIF